MSALFKKLQEFTIFEGITCHPAWHGNIPGIDAERMLRGLKTPYLYILRKGEPSTKENEEHYYVSFILPDFSIRHQPVVVSIGPEGWCYENAGPGGPYQNFSIDPVLHLIMHCEEGECVPFIKR
ncbi:MAG TPA: hypothetical protein VLE96_06570 [Chlamydiales bacterium]|nr:hypothetical protein [Chlamydiales bacterium]